MCSCVSSLSLRSYGRLFWIGLRGSSKSNPILWGLDVLWDFDSAHQTHRPLCPCHDFSPCPWRIRVPLWMRTRSCSRLAIQPPQGRQAPITILSRLCWFSGSNPCSRCLLSTHLLWQPSDKQRLVKEVFHKQILPAGQWLKRPFLSPSSGTRPYWAGPLEPCIESGYGPALRPSGLGPPSRCPWTPVPIYPQRGNPTNWTSLPSPDSDTFYSSNKKKTSWDDFSERLRGTRLQKRCLVEPREEMYGGIFRTYKTWPTSLPATPPHCAQSG